MGRWVGGSVGRWVGGSVGRYLTVLHDHVRLLKCGIKCASKRERDEEKECESEWSRLSVVPRFMCL